METDGVQGARSGTRFGPYELRSLLGRGGRGSVYEAFDTVKNRTVAVKLLAEEVARDPVYQVRFRRESQAAARLADPHVVPIHDWGVIDGTLFLDMRLIAGLDLRAVLTRDGAMAPERAVGIVEQVAAALDAAHTAGLVHRDVKPTDILLTPTDFAYLTDFGIADTEGDSAVTMVGVSPDSYAYTAPERFDAGPVAAAADIYALTCVLYECLTGTTPYPADTLNVLLRAHLTEPPPRPSVTRPGLPAALDAVIARGLAKAPHDRFGSALELARAARAAVGGAAGSVRPAAAGNDFDAFGRGGGTPPADVPAPPAPAGPPVAPGPARASSWFDPGPPRNAAPAANGAPGGLQPEAPPATATPSAPPTGDVPAPMDPAAPRDPYPPRNAGPGRPPGVPGPYPPAANRQPPRMPAEATPPVSPDSDAGPAEARPVVPAGTPVPNPATGATLVVRVPEHLLPESDRIPDATGEHAVIKPSGPTEVRLTETQFTLPAATEPEPPAPGSGQMRAFPDAHLYEGGQQYLPPEQYRAPEPPPDNEATRYIPPVPAVPAPETRRYPAAGQPVPPGADPEVTRYIPDQAYSAVEPAYDRGDEPEHPRTEYLGAYAGQPEAGYDDRGYDGYRDPGPEGYADDGYRDEPYYDDPDDYDESYPAEEQPRKRSFAVPLLATAVVVAALILVSVIGWQFYAGGDDTAPVASNTTATAAPTTASRPGAPPADPAAPTTTSARPTTTAPSSSASSTTSASRTSTSATTTTGAAALPAGAAPCDSSSGAAAPYSRTATGSEVTSCGFAAAVLDAYSDAGADSARGAPRSVVAISPVTGRSYTMNCTSDGEVVTCVGGDNAVVYVY